MSKLEEKLAASINPEPDKAPPAASAPAATPAPKPAAKSRPATKSATTPRPVPNLNDPKRPLHPTRIWPD